MPRRYPNPSHARRTTSTRSWPRRLLKWIAVLCIWGLILLAGIVAWYARDLPDVVRSAQTERRASITVLANDGSVIGRYGDIKGSTLRLDEMPKDVIDAVLSIEDRRFYYHYGVDPIGLIRALTVNTMHGNVRQGGSTITQQLAKNLFLSQQKTYQRKIKEALLAVWLEWELSKDEILAAYLNRVYMGAGTYGVDAAARVYFDKPAHQMNLRESATLAGLLRAPSRYSPTNNAKESAKRAKVVLAAMVDNGKITQAEADKAAKGFASGNGGRRPGGSSSRYFADWVVDGLDDLIGKPENDIIVETTLDPEIQSAAAAAISKGVTQNAKLLISQGAAIVLRPDGSIVGMVGGADYNLSQFNRAGQGSRQPGSSFKPFVYLAALESGWDQYSPIVDQPIYDGKYHPQNFGNKYYGQVTLTDALTMSMNSVAVQLARNVGVNHVISVARRMGITAKLDPNLSLALGSSEVPMLEMAQAYATIASGGYAVKAYGIRQIRETASKKTLFRYEAEAAPRVFRERDIAQLSRMMESVVTYGTGQAAKGPYFAAGKTGTTQNHRDAWFDGFTNDYVASIWFGNDNNKSMKAVTGGSVSARAWKEIITAAKADPTPSKNNLLRSGGVSDEFSDMLSGLVSKPPPVDLPAQPVETTLPDNYQMPAGRFVPDRPGDRIGYSRMND